MVEEEKEVKQPFKDTTFGKILLVLWEIIYYGMIYLTGISIVYGGYNEVEVPQFLLTLVLIGILTQHKSLKQDYKYWESIAPDDMFYKCFTNRYKMQPLFPVIVIMFLLARYCSIGSFIILYIVITSYDLWDRRYITNDIKHDLILNEFKQTNRFQ